jgi:hypothetical protein
LGKLDPSVVTTLSVPTSLLIIPTLVCVVPVALLVWWLMEMVLVGMVLIVLARTACTPTNRSNYGTDNCDDPNNAENFD